jgi:hypothetical protein
VRAGERASQRGMERPPFPLSVVFSGGCLMLDSSFFVRFVVLLDAFCLTVRFVVFLLL